MSFIQLFVLFFLGESFGRSSCRKGKQRGEPLAPRRSSASPLTTSHFAFIRYTCAEHLSGANHIFRHRRTTDTQSVSMPPAGSQGKSRCLSGTVEKRRGQCGRRTGQSRIAEGEHGHAREGSGQESFARHAER